MAVLFIVLGYLIGSLPTAYIAGRIIAGGDIRRIGDANMGAANTFRKIGRRAGVIVGLVDAGKGALVIVIARAAGLSEVAVMLAGLAAVIGHNWPVFIGFRGGRGVSTILGILLVLEPVPVLVLAAPVIVIIIIAKGVTPSMLFFFVMLPLVGWWFGVSLPLILYGIGLGVLSGVTSFFRTRKRRGPAPARRSD